MIGSTFYRNNRETGKAFFLLGEKSSNGKSTLLEFLKVLLGADNYSTVSFEGLNERFQTAEIAGKIANIGDDISGKYNEASAVFKKLTTGEALMAERKGKDPFKLENYATLIFSANRMPKTEDKSAGTAKKRMLIIPFNAVFKDTDPDYDPTIDTKLREEQCLEYGILLGIKGLQRLINNKFQYTIPDIVKEAKKEYETFNNPVLAFLEAQKEAEESYNISNYTTTEVIFQFNHWCEDNGYKKMSAKVLGAELKRLGYESQVYKVEGKAQRKYIRVTDIK